MKKTNKKSPGTSREIYLNFNESRSMRKINRTLKLLSPNGPMIKLWMPEGVGESRLDLTSFIQRFGII